MKRALIALVLLLPAAHAAAQEIGFVEDFALAKDRSDAIKQLIPGTGEYYYYLCLHYQNLGELGQVDQVLNQWYKTTEASGNGRDEIEIRQALLKYDKDPQRSLETIRQKLNLQFNHQRETVARQPDYPTRLDNKLISREALTEYCRSYERRDLQNFEDSALDWLIDTQLSDGELRDLLNRLRRPDYDKMVARVVEDLKKPYNRRFGSYPIHRLLLQSQLDELLKHDADLLNDSNYVLAYLSKLQPDEDVNLAQDVEAQKSHLDRMWKFAERLGPAHNSLKAHVLFHRLLLDRNQGIYDRERFMTYLQLPRPLSYVEPRLLRDYQQKYGHNRYYVNLSANYQQQTLLPPVQSDEPLVRDYLLHFLKDADDYKAFVDLIETEYLKRAYAEAKIVNGIGDMAKWFTLMPAAAHLALKDRVDIDFAFTNKQMFAPAEQVSLDLLIKNVDKLIVKVYEINALNFYRENGQEIDTTIELDGLVANEEKVHTYDVGPLLRAGRRFTFPELKDRGVYVIEFIGNGKSSRAVVRKGQLRHVVRTSTAGHVFTILDEDDNIVKDARIFLGGHEYTPDEDGTVTVPLTSQPGSQPIVIARGDFACLDHFVHEREIYSFSAGFYVDREALLKRGKAEVIIRPLLQLNGTPVTLKVLEDVKLSIVTTDMDGVQSTQDVSEFKLAEIAESTHTFTVPERLAHISFNLTAQVQQLTTGQKQGLAASASFEVNTIDRTERIEDLFLLRIAGNYYIDVLGKTGEARPHRPVNVTFKHHDFRRTRPVSLQSDENGRVDLGPLVDIDQVTAQTPSGSTSVVRVWQPSEDAATYLSTLHGRVGQPLRVPYLGSADKPQRDELSLLELRGGNDFKTDRFNSLRVEGGFIVIDDLSAGDYDLWLKRPNHHVHIRLTDGIDRAGYVLSDTRNLQTRALAPLQIVSVSGDRDGVTIKLANASKFARVHVIVTRYLPEFPIFQQLAYSPTEPGYGQRVEPETLYVAGRDIGDEYRYILDRKFAKHYPGNMLTRPGLLLNPWAIRDTEAGRQWAAPGGAYARESAKQGMATGGRGGRFEGRANQGQAAGYASNMDFLARSSTVLSNLLPDKDGVIRIAPELLGDRQHVHVMAADPETTIYRQLTLAEPKGVMFRDLRLVLGLDPAAHLVELKRVSTLLAGQKFTIGDVATSEMETYDSLAKLYRLFATLSHDATLAEFSFVTDWPKLDDKTKLEKYSKYACHELNFFLARKDPKFFAEIIKPYLRNKKDKTFMDRYLIGEDLSSYVQPWAYGQLNAAERVLLGRAIAAERPRTARTLRDLFNLIPPNQARWNHLFDTALKAGALETGPAGPRSGWKAENTVYDRVDGKELEAGAAMPADMAALRGPGRAPSAPPVTATPAPAEPSAAPPMAKPQAEAQKKLKDMEQKADNARDRMVRRELAAEGEEADSAGYYLQEDLKRRAAVRQLYRKLEKTKEWAENNYYHLLIEQQNAGLIDANAFWADWAEHAGDGAFLSPNVAEATGNFAEMMLALAATDLPFEAPKHEEELKDPTFTLTAAGPIIVYHKQVGQAKAAEEKTPILVSQNFFRTDDRYVHVNNQRRDKYVTEEFLPHVVYGCQVVLTNPTSSPQKLDLLLQIPRGAMPVLGGRYTRGATVDIGPFATQKFEYHFYFPRTGKYLHYPVHVADDGMLIAFAEPFTFNVVEQLSKVDKTSWAWISQNGTEDQVMQFLNDENVHRLDLGKIAWRMKDADFFRRVIDVLGVRHAWNDVLYSYGIKHNHVPAVREYLQHQEGFLVRCGRYIDCTLVTIDPVVRKWYQHLEYSPLVNARAHRLSARRKIVNDAIFQQYQRLMHVLCYNRELDNDALMAVTYYMLLQDRIEEGLAFFDRVDPAKLATRVQHDYFAAYVAFYREQPDKAREIAGRYADYKVDRWQKLFANVIAQADEIQGKVAAVVNPEDRDQAQGRLAATEPSIDLNVEARRIKLSYRNLKQVRVNYYLMDIELMFSRRPFVQNVSGGFAFIRPNMTATVDLPEDKQQIELDLPARFASANVMVEVVGAGQRKAEPYYANTLAVQLLENYGQVQVGHAETGKPLSKVYVKVYAKLRDGRVQFYKDGYTDLRGRFDYASLNTDEINMVERYSLLVLSEDHGAVVREAEPPKR